MENISVKKDDLLKVLEKNRAEHRKIYEEALEGYRKLLISEFSRRLDDAKAGRRIDTAIRVTQPEDHTEDYDAVIAMIKMDLSDTVKLDESDFRNYVMDQWGWSKNFYLSNSTYSALASSKLKS